MYTVYVNKHTGTPSGLVISQADARPMYVQILEQIRQRVALGDWAPGQEIPSIRQLAVELQVSVITIKRAYLELERDGVIVTQQGKGSRVGTASGLGPALLERQLDEHLREAARLARGLALSPDDFGARARRAALLSDEEPHDDSRD